MTLPACGTHIPILAGALSCTSGAVIELGAGWYSTPMLHAMCEVDGRSLYTLEASKEWLEKFHNLQTDRHHLYLHNYEAMVQFLATYTNLIGVVFVDHGSIEMRAPCIVEALRVSDLVVVHDTESLDYGYEPVLSQAKYRRDFKMFHPWTSVVSNFQEIPQFLPE